MIPNFHIITPSTPWGIKKTPTQELRERQDEEELFAKLMVEAAQAQANDASAPAPAAMGLSHEHFKQIRKHYGHHDWDHPHTDPELVTRMKEQDAAPKPVVKQEVKTEPAPVKPVDPVPPKQIATELVKPTVPAPATPVKDTGLGLKELAPPSVKPTIV